MAKKQRTLGQVIEEQAKWEEEKKNIEEKLRKIKLLIDALSEEALLMMDDIGIERTATDKATATLMEIPSYRIEDWAKFTEWARKHNHLEMFHSRTSVNAVEEYLDAGHKLPPGLKKHVSRYVNVRSK